MKKNKDTQRGYFYEGAYPTADQMRDVVDGSLGVLESVSDLPLASADNLNDEYKIGNTYYKCVLNKGGYSWQPSGNAVRSNDYSDLENKPKVGGVTLIPYDENHPQRIKDFGGLDSNDALYSLAEELDNNDILYVKTSGGWKKTLVSTILDAFVSKTPLGGFATKVELAAARTEIVNLASAAVQSLLSSKMDVSADDVSESSMLDEDAYVYVIAEEGLRKVKVKTLENYFILKTASTSSVKEAVRQMYSKIEYVVEDEYTISLKELPYEETICVFLNGQLLTIGKDYQYNQPYVQFQSELSDKDTLVVMGILM